MTQRRWVCYKSENKLKACIDIILSNPYKKWIVFSHQTEFADRLSEILINEGILAISYHSKLNKAQKNKVLDTAKSKLCSVICSAQALNTGYNLPDIDAAICVSSTGTELTFIQELGRTTRLNDDGSTKTSTFITLYSSSTQERTWVENKIKNLSHVELDIKSLLNFVKLNV
jgi:superfamily II DNA or RNA helicase